MNFTNPIFVSAVVDTMRANRLGAIDEQTRRGQDWLRRPKCDQKKLAYSIANTFREKKELDVIYDNSFRVVEWSPITLGAHSTPTTAMFILFVFLPPAVLAAPLARLLVGQFLFLYTDFYAVLCVSF